MGGVTGPGPSKREEEPAARPPERRDACWKDAGLVLLLALIARVALLPWLGHLPLAGDEQYYWDYSEYLERGEVDWLVLRPPAWSLLVVAARTLHDDPLAGRALATLIGALTAPVIYLLGRRIFGRRAGLAAGLILAFYPEHVGYSHYLWSECLFTLEIALVLLFLLRFLESGRRSDLVLGSAVAGIALATKVFAVIVFAAMIVTLVLFERRARMANVAVASLLFLLPATLHSVVASRAAGRRIVLGETGVLSMRQAVGLDPPGGLNYDPERRDEQAAELVRTLRERPFSRAVRDVSRQFANLWTPNSFVSHRLLVPRTAQHAEKRAYGVPLAWGLPLTVAVTAAYILVLVLGLAGLCLSDTTPFKVFSVVCLVGLCATTLVTFSASRYRAPFVFLFVIQSAQLLTHPRLVFDGLLRPRRALALLALLVGFAHVTLTEMDTIGAWG